MLEGPELHEICFGYQSPGAMFVSVERFFPKLSV